MKAERMCEIWAEIVAFLVCGKGVVGRCMSSASPTDLGMGAVSEDMGEGINSIKQLNSSLFSQ